MTGRFAIYAAPGAGRRDPVGVLLRQRAEQWLGRSVSSGPGDAGSPVGWTRAAIDAMTVNARRYGFHATLKAPFRLAEGRTPEELDAAVARFAAGRDAAVIPRLTLARLGGFFALVPGAEAPGLYALADEVVTAFDDFRAPTTGPRSPAATGPPSRRASASCSRPGATRTCWTSSAFT